MIRPLLLVWLACAALVCALRADAQPVTTLYAFSRGAINPKAGLTLGPDGSFYGTTAAGGRNLGGTAFRITTNGVLTMLSSFGNYPTGSDPSGDLTLGPDGNFYGTANGGGTNLSGVDDGTVFKMTTNGVVTAITTFNGTNGHQPAVAVTLGPDGYYYGTTEFAGTGNAGTLFKIATNGAVTTLVNFNTNNGANPFSALTLTPGGTFYGSTEAGGRFGLGTAFKLTTNGDFTTVCSFDGTNGVAPEGRMALGPDGNLYGTTYSMGTAFKMTTNGVVTSMVDFNLLSLLSSDSFTNGTYPRSGLTLGPDGQYYGTTSQGGANGTGTIFKVSTNGTAELLAQMPGVQVEYLTNGEGVVFYSTNNFATSDHYVFGILTTLYNFSALSNSDNGDGADPESDLTVGPDGKLYGTTVGGGTNGAGAAFKISTNGTFTALASMPGDTGYNPYAGVTAGPGGSLYGVVTSGGSAGEGTAFKVSAAGQFTLLHNFSYFPDGANPQANLIQGPNGNFYGTAVGGGTNLLETAPNTFQADSFGTVFELATNGIFTTLACFNGTNGANPYGGLTLGPDGNFYGTTAYGGISNNGVVFQLLTNGTMAALTNFTGANGANPYEGLTLGPDNNFYGTTEAGGSSNVGTVFQVTPAGALTTLVQFSNTNGANPNAGLTAGRDGNLYGTTYTAGGTGNFGTVFKVTTGGALTTLYSFAQTNFAYPHGRYPIGGLAQGPDGYLYGTTSLGGVNGSSQGTLFKITTNGTFTTLYSFIVPNGGAPFATMMLQTNSHFINFFGTTLGDGGDHPGTVFRVNQTTSYVITENTAHTFSPLTNDLIWTTGGTLGLVTAVGSNGTAQVSGPGIAFTPTTNFAGTATINYTVTDNAGGTSASFITILVTNIPPVANPDFYSVAENSGATALSPLANDVIGTSGGVLKLLRVSPTNGTAVISGANILFTPALNFAGTATIGYTMTDSIGGTNTSLITVTVANPSADLSLTAGAAPEPVGVSNNLVYSIIVSNAGPSTATGVTVSNLIPANVTFVSATGGATPSGGVLLLDLGPLAAGATNLAQITVQPAMAGKLTNLFQIFANETDPVLTNNLAMVVSTVTNAAVVAAANLSLGVTESPNPVDAAISNLVTYTFTVTNAGPSAATDVTVSNQIFVPGSPFIFDTATGGSQPTNGILLINLGPLAAGATTTAQMTAHLERTADTPTTYYTNLFQVLADQNDPNPADNFATVIFVGTNANVTQFTTSTRTFTTNLMATVKQQTTNFSTELIAVMPGTGVVYDQTFTVPFADPAVQTGVTVAAGDLTVAGATSYVGPGQKSLMQAFQNQLLVLSTNLVGTNISVTVTQYVGPQTVFVGTEQSQPLVLPAGHTDFDTLVTAYFTNLITTTITSNYLNTSVYVMTGTVAQVDVTLTLTGSPNPVTVGDPLTYSLTVTNKSTTTATGVVVSNTLPASVTLNSALASQGSATNQSGIVTYAVGPLPNGSSATLAIVVVPNVAGSLTNTAIATSVQTDSQPANNVVTNITTAVSGAITNLALTVLSSITLNSLTGLYEQRIQVANGGPATPSSVRVLVSGLPGNDKLYNAMGITNGTPYVQSSSPLGVGSNIVFLLEYYAPNRVAPANLTLTVQAGPVVIPAVVTGTISSIDRTTVRNDGSVVVEFSAVPGQIYAVQYSSDMVTWRTAVPAITAPTSRVQWIDAGPPKTDSNPASQSARYYRVVLLPAH